ncbi:hypothetical protein HMPREF1981_01912 [Bacteroides pyogenes F0041]|uniref:Uncharacterized protein n=1 Tax=Bacteroides pyogenes F0041 TaxID=1321819 RepID=U2CL54_9BACE|nr:hypothetical protein HMPREF1981_01912 [Bacteroides pyogenes F0041]
MVISLYLSANLQINKDKKEDFLIFLSLLNHILYKKQEYSFLREYSCDRDLLKRDQT